METTKTQFQADLSKMETLFWQLQYSYPLNFGMPFRLNLSYIIMLLAVCMLADEYCCGDLYTRTSFVALVLLVYGIVQWNRDAGSDMTDASGNYKYLSKQLTDAIMSAEIKYSDYPDVNSLLQKIKASSAAVSRQKSITLTVFRVLVCGAFLLYGVKIYSDYTARHTKEKNTTEITNTRSQSDYYYKELALEKEKPFLQISPLTTEIADGITLQGNAIDVYLHYYERKQTSDSPAENNIYRCLKTIVPKITGGEPSDQYHLTITDTNGKPISGCPDFVFSQQYAGKIMVSSNFSPNAYSTQYKFQALHTLKKLKANQKELRFVVKKI